MPAAKDLIHETSSSTGTGNFALAAVNGKVRFSDGTHGFGTGGTNVFDYFISNRDAAQWERGTGHMGDANTLVRDTVLKSSNGNALVSFSAGTKDVTNDLPATNQARQDTGTFTPSLDFDGNANDMRYTTRTGRYTKMGKLVTFTLTIALSEKGDSTGQAIIRDLPFTAAANVALPAYVGLTTLTTQHVQPFIDGTLIRLRYLSGGNSVPVTHNEITDTTLVIISGTYEATV
jgi:hypothetical protein